jgi:pyruvate/2-oxoglutarate/acetoin dehydrogenase E1 component
MQYLLHSQKTSEKTSQTSINTQVPSTPYHKKGQVNFPERKPNPAIYQEQAYSSSRTPENMVMERYLHQSRWSD